MGNMKICRQQGGHIGNREAHNLNVQEKPVGNEETDRKPKKI